MSGCLGLNNGQWLAATAEKYVVGIALAGGGGHTVHFYLDTSLAALYVTLYIEDVPAGLFKHIVNEVLARNGFTGK